MSNECSNILTIRGSKSEISFLPWTISDTQQQLFAPILPNPQDAMQVWGCKSNPQIETIERSNKEVRIEFNSPWSPPIAGIVNLSKLFPALEWHLDYVIYGEELGRAKAKSGKLLWHQTKKPLGRETVCDNCHKTYRPEIDWEEKITDDYCPYCQ